MNITMGNAALPNERGRAWIEIDLDALAYNLADIRSKVPAGCEVMAVVKANAYGHGVERVAMRLVSEGIKVFAVATVDEGIELRKHVSEGEILVFGYTHPEDVRLLFENKLTQLVIDGEYAKALNDTGYRLNVHVEIDTGMHRLGVELSNFAEIESIFSNENLTVKGIATQLSSSDSLDASDVDFTNAQMEKFLTVADRLKSKGYNVGKLHAQASYGIYNYSGSSLDYVRPGIMLYGADSKNNDTKIETDLRPVLSLKALIAQVRWIEAGESVSYSRKYTAEKPIKLATVCIGYADGVPRQMSGNGGLCIVGGVKVPIVGRITMDMLMLDVTQVENVQAGDIATIIGKDGNEEIRCEYVAGASGTITYDILSRLGGRLPRIYL
jgi:serine/alanine racemase